MTFENRTFETAEQAIQTAQRSNRRTGVILRIQRREYTSKNGGLHQVWYCVSPTAMHTDKTPVVAIVMAGRFTKVQPFYDLYAA